MPNVNIQLVDDGHKVELALSYRGDGEKVERTSFLKAHEDTPLGQFFLLTDEFNSVLDKYNEFVDGLHSPEDGLGTTFSGVVGEKKNAFLKITIADDKMSAEALLFSSYGGSHVSANQIIKMAQEEGVTFGFDKQAVVALAAKSSKSKPGTEFKQVIAVGKLPIDGIDAQFDQKVSCFKDRILKPQAKDEKSDSVDMRNLGAIVSVKPGDVVMEKIAMIRGKRGSNVVGDVIEPKGSVDKEFQAGGGTEISPKNPNLLVATIAGLPRRLEYGMAVEDVFEVPKVDVSVGNIQYEGSVVVNGDVGEGMHIKASGDINITGYVDSAIIEAKGDVVIGKAAIGRQIDGDADSNTAYSTVIKAQGNIFIRQAQYIEVHCDKQLTVERQLLHSRVTAQKVLVGSEEKVNGKVIGGEFNLIESMRVGVLGAPSGSRSAVNLNQLFDKIVAKRNQLRDVMDEQKTIMEEIKTAVEHIKALPNSEEKKNLLTESVANFEKHKKILKHVVDKNKALETKQRALFEDCRIEVTNRIFSGVDLAIGSEKTRTKREHGPSKVVLVDGKLRIDPL